MSKIKPKGIIVHSMGEYIDDRGDIYTARDWLEKLNLSVHAFIHPDGNVEPMVKTDTKALHAGKSEHNGLEHLNNHYLGFELLVKGKHNYGTFLEAIKKDDCYSDAQFKTAKVLTKVWMEEYNIPKENVVRHSDVSGDNVRGKGKGKVDPGKGFNWNKFKQEI